MHECALEAACLCKGGLPGELEVVRRIWQQG